MTDRTVITLRSLTVSIKAERLLSESRIAARTVKVASPDDGGCRYGVSIPRADAEASLDILKKNGVFPEP